MRGDEGTIEIVNPARMKLVLAKMRTQERFVILTWHEANLLAIRFVHYVMRDAQRVGDTTRVRHRLWPAAFVLRSRNAVLRPHFHRHPNDVVALLAQQVTSDAGIDSAAHAKKHALFISRIHPRKIGERLLLVNRHPEPKPRDPVKGTLSWRNGIPRLRSG